MTAVGLPIASVFEYEVANRENQSLVPDDAPTKITSNLQSSITTEVSVENDKEALQRKKLIVKRRKMNWREKIVYQTRLINYLSNTDIKTSTLSSSHQPQQPERKAPPFTEMKKKRLEREKSMLIDLDVNLQMEGLNQQEVFTRVVTVDKIQQFDTFSSPSFCTLQNSQQLDVFLSFKRVHNAIRSLKKMLSSETLDFEDAIDTILESDTVPHLLSYLDFYLLNNYSINRNVSTDNCNNTSEQPILTLKQIYGLQLEAAKVFSKVSISFVT